ncbi:hypothetical protein [Yinghuangia seranimata]|uniref:hypothetical protein n=1 Tax=Yinghuangia seranimata TaxID=408067 RepID=UPI00248BE848|nr:hypothetical protein [Yinghuangia seranimata]MDI2129044.1 hypothetical protein [Yinghuangia seranimata]
MAQTWVPEACTLPTREQPLRAAGFDALFGALLAEVARPEPTRARLTLPLEVEARARDLAQREACCCSFFTFTFGRTDADTVWMDVAVPGPYVAVLDAMVGRAEASRTGAA